MTAQNMVNLDVSFSDKIGNKITLFRFRERTKISIFSPVKETFMAKLICRIERDGKILYQTGTHNSPILRISEGDNLFEGDVVIPMDEINKMIIVDSLVCINYDLFFLERMSQLKEVGLSFSVAASADGQLTFSGQVVAQKNKYHSLNDFKSLLEEKISRSKISNVQHISEAVVGYMQIQQAIALAYEGF